MRKIVIIGATSGIGKKLAELYINNDAKIVIIGRREDKLREIAATNPGKYIYRVCDISDTDVITNRLDDIVNQLGYVDLMIITAGAGELNPELSYQLEEISLKTNVLGWTCVVDLDDKTIRETRIWTLSFNQFNWRITR